MAVRRLRAFSLLELLVVIAIIVVLLGIMVPSLAQAHDTARVAVNLTNLHQMGLGVAMYLTENDNYFFVHEGNFNPPGQFSDDVRDNSGTNSFSDAQQLVADGLVADVATANRSRRAHWVDYVGEYCTSPKAFVSPMLTTDELRLFTLDFVKPGSYKHYKWGGYGYNMQFLGREWTATTPAYRAKIGREVIAPSTTVVIGDSAGSRRGATPPGGLMSNSYVIDPPLYTINTGTKVGKYYQGVDAATSDADLAATPLGSTNWRYRVFPAPRNQGKAGFVFADGHAETLFLKQVDDFNNDGLYDNGYWNGNGESYTTPR